MLCVLYHTLYSTVLKGKERVMKLSSRTNLVILFYICVKREREKERKRERENKILNVDV